MKSIGSLLFILGAGSFVLNMLGMQFTVLQWIDNWGETTGLGIRVGLIAVGAGLWFVGRKQQAAQPRT